MLNLDARTKSKLVWVATLMVPVLAVQGVRFFGASAGPSAASAATAPAQAGPIAAMPDEPEKPLTPAQLKAKAWVAEHGSGDAPRSPMDRPDADDQPPPRPPVLAETPASRPTPTPVAPTASASTSPESAVSRFNLSAMLVAERGGRALARINHKVYRVGDSIASSWTVHAIDARRRLVVITDAEGRHVELHAPFPNPLEDEPDDALIPIPATK